MTNFLLLLAACLLVALLYWVRDFTAALRSLSKKVSRMTTAFENLQIADAALAQAVTDNLSDGAAANAQIAAAKAEIASLTQQLADAAAKDVVDAGTVQSIADQLTSQVSALAAAHAAAVAANSALVAATAPVDNTQPADGSTGG